MMINKLLWTVLLLNVSTVFGQITVKTDEGNVVLLNADGTWTYEGKETQTAISDKKQNLPSKDCDYQKNEVDEFTEKVIKVLNPQNLIKHTPDNLQSFYKKESFVETAAFLASSNGNVFLYMNWIIRSKKAYDTYGYIKKGAKLMLKLENGEVVDLSFRKSDTGDIDYDDNLTSFMSTCYISPENMSLLKKSPIQKIRMSWTKGYQEYTPENLSLLIDQIPCVE